VTQLANAAPQDVPGARDPELLSQRFQDAVIYHYEQHPFDSYEVPTGGATGAKKLASSRIVEGKITDVRYAIPAERSILEVYRNYENALKAKGFEVLFACEDKSCGGREFNHIAGLRARGFQETPRGQRFIAAHLSRPQGDAYITVLVVKDYGIGGPNKDKVNVRVVTAEAKSMDSKLVTVDAAQMKQAIADSGHIALYGILFEFDSARLLPESRAAIDEIAKLLKQSSNLKLHVVGHSDDKGTLTYNLDLSKRRAQEVVQELVSSHGISASRLVANGIGPLAPVASNENEDGRAKNRRVELVEFIERR
jgi:outer membrane protein OmpA-like peptidoglycan-associated protein